MGATSTPTASPASMTTTAASSVRPTPALPPVPASTAPTMPAPTGTVPSSSRAPRTPFDITATGTAGEYWAVGGTLSSLDANATFYHSTNSGNSWTLDSTISGSYAPCVDSKHCWATTLQVLQTSSVAALSA